MPITAFNSFTDGLDPIEGAANTSLPTPTWKMTASGFLMQMVSGSSPAASTSRLADSA